MQVPYVLTAWPVHVSQHASLTWQEFELVPAYNLRNSLIILIRSVDTQTLLFCLFTLCILCAGLTELRFVSKDAIFLRKLFRTVNVYE